MTDIIATTMTGQTTVLAVAAVTAFQAEWDRQTLVSATQL
jgi:hypothetical protein